LAKEMINLAFEAIFFQHFRAVFSYPIKCYDMLPTALLPSEGRNGTDLAGFEHANLGSNGKHITVTPPR
jgi:hypothetical protein